MTAQLASATRVAAPTRGGLRYIPTVALGTDLVLITFAVFLAILGQRHMPFGLADIAVGDSLGVVGPAMILGWVAALFLFGAYRTDVFGAGVDEFKRVLNASLATAALVGIACYAGRFDLPRGYFLLAFGVAIPTMLLGRLLLRRSVHQARRRGVLLHRVVIAGSEGHVDEIASVLRRETWLGYEVVGALTPCHGERETTHSGIPVLGTSSSVARVAVDIEADVVFLAGGAFDSAEQMRQLAWELEHEPVQVVIAPSVTDVVSDRVSVRPVGGLPLIHLEQPRSQNAARLAKRCFDVLASVVLLLIALPVLAWAAWRIRSEDGAPVLVRQTRTGRNGREFRAWMLRTEHHDPRDVPGQGELFFEPWSDPRLTTTGRWLRRYSLDELPLLLNVLRGDMSLVGPRAPMAHEVADLADSPRLRVRPGLTGVWRDFRRSDLSWSETVLLDVHYADHWSVLQDITILARTVAAVASGAQVALR